MGKVRGGDILRLVTAVAVCLLVGFAGSLSTAPSIPAWYAGLAKPSFNPPNWVFAPVWTVLYVLMGICAFLIWRQGLGKPGVPGGLILFVIQLALNATWTPVFFGLHMLWPAFGVIVALWFAILLTMLKFFKLSRTAGALLVPYLAWVTFASGLNLSLAVLN
jgi:benzodiazapine receptor